MDMKGLKRWVAAGICALLPMGAYAKPWVTGYLPGYTQDSSGNAPYMEDADWSMLTHVIHFGAGLNGDGTLNDSGNNTGYTNRQKAIALAHSKNLPILTNVVAWEDVHKPVLADPVKRQTLVNNLLARVDEGFDGVDIDLEPIVSWGQTANADYEMFIHMLYEGLQQRTSTLLQRHPLLTVAADERAKTVLSHLHTQLDQINIMFYNMATVNEGITWHDAALYGGDRKYPSTGGAVSSVDNYIRQLLAAGVPRDKLGVGMSFEIRIWQGGGGTATGGVTAPQQAWTTAPKEWTTGTPMESYAQLMDNRYQQSQYHWDDVAKMGYLGIDQDGSANDQFISFNDPRSVAEKVQYMKKMELGGLMIWHLQLDYRASKTGTKRRELMHSIRNTLSAGK
jgi:GH18 family chitinase